MNKQEIEEQIKQASAEREAITDKLIELKQQLFDILLAEPEKPKLRHGDFGLEENNSPTIILRETQYGDPSDLRSIREGHSCQSSNRTKPEYCHIYLILGNIFDLLKEWSEDLEEFTYAGVHFRMKGRVLEISIHDEMMTITGLESQMEAWTKFGRLIATLKRKSKAG